MRDNMKYIALCGDQASVYTDWKDLCDHCVNDEGELDRDIEVIFGIKNGEPVKVTFEQVLDWDKERTEEIEGVV